MTSGTTEDSRDDTAGDAAATEHYRQVGRFIYGTARLESSLALLLDAMGDRPADPADPADLHANVRLAQARFAALPAAEGDRIAFTALMHVLASFAQQRDPMFAAIADMPADELAARNEALAAAAAELRRFAAMAPALSA